MPREAETMNAFGLDAFTCRKISRMNPSEYISWMYQRTEESGTLIVPDWQDEGPHAMDHWLICQTEWTTADRDRAITDWEGLYAALSEIAKVYLELCNDDRATYGDYLSGDLHTVYRTYLCPLQSPGIDEEDIRDIRQRMEIIRACDGLRLKETLGEALSEEEKGVLRDGRDVRVERGERLLLEAYEGCIRDRAADRVGEGPFAVSLVLGAQRLWRAMTRRAPQICIRYEAMRLAQTMALHRIANDVTAIAPVN